MMADMKHGFRVFTLLTLFASACQDQGPELRPVQVQGEFVAYAAFDEVELCEGTATYADAWMRAVATRLEIDPAALLPTTYYYVDSSVTDKQCPGGSPHCARMEDGQILIFSQNPLHRHELAHAVHLSAWPAGRVLLREGLASLFGEVEWTPGSPLTAEEIDVAIEARSAVDEPSVYGIGLRIVYWTLLRHGPAAFEQFWYASSELSSAAAFRAEFQDHFGESLDAMLDDVAEESHSSIALCPGEPRGWENGSWTMRSPRGCEDDGVYGSAGSYDYGVRRESIMEITQPGTYEITVSHSPSNGQGVFITQCQDLFAAWLLHAGTEITVELEPGRYRVTTEQSAPEDEGVRVEIRPAN